MTNKTIPHDQISAGGPSYLNFDDNENHENHIVGSAPVQIKTTLTTKKARERKRRMEIMKIMIMRVIIITII
jgi:hypothetical protein